MVRIAPRFILPFIQLTHPTDHHFHLAPQIESEERINEYELSENIDIYYISNSNIECIGLQAFAPNWYRDIKSKRDIEKIIQTL